MNHNETIAEQAWNDQGIQLGKGRKRSRIINFDRQSYDRRIVVSKEIDINQRAIRDEVKIKKEIAKKRPR